MSFRCKKTSHWTLLFYARHCPMSSTYFKACGHSKNKIEIKGDSSNYATKSGSKMATVVDTSQFGKKDDLAILKSGVDELDVD